MVRRLADPCRSKRPTDGASHGRNVPRPGAAAPVRRPPRGAPVHDPQSSPNDAGLLPTAR